MTTIELILALLAVMALLAGIARKIGIPYPIFLTLGGLLIGLIPGLPAIELEPELVFLIFLPPILVSAGFFTPVRDFKSNLRSITLLAVGLVLFTTVVVAAVARWLLPELPWPACFALGAIVAPPDAVAATSVAKRLNLPRRLITVLEGESLVNDASALVALRVAVAAGLTGAFSLGGAALDFIVASGGGILIGLAVGWLMAQLLARTEDSPIEILATFVGSFAAYIIGERLHVSGVLACVVLGIYIGRASARVMSAETRVNAGAVWNLVVFLFNGLVFILIGLQLPVVLRHLNTENRGALAIGAVGVCLAAIVTRIIWVFPGTYLPRYLSAKIRAADPYPSWQTIAVLGWTGMRGIVSLAAALALPSEFPGRDLILFLTFCVILATLVGQGLTLPWLIRTLGLTETDDKFAREEDKARLAAAKAGLRRLEELAQEDWAQAHHVEDLRLHYEARRDRFVARYQRREDVPEHDGEAEALRRLQDELLEAELVALVELRDSGVINDESMRVVQRELDFEKLRLGGVSE